MNESPAMPPSETSTPSSLAQNKALRQFVKFCIVGASNFALDFGSSYVLIYMFHVDWRIANTISFIIGVSNSFYWNSRWTFKALDHDRQAKQYFQFFTINVIGWVLNLTIMSCVIFVLSGTWQEAKPDKLHFIVAKLLATVIVVAWNFGANKKWTFKA